jgi:hypothetical protein
MQSIYSAPRAHRQTQNHAVPDFGEGVRVSFTRRRRSAWPTSWHIHPQMDSVIVALLAYGDTQWMTPREWRRFHEAPDYFELRAMQFRLQLVAEGKVVR